MRKSGWFFGVSAIALTAAISLAGAPSCVAAGTCEGKSFGYNPSPTSVHPFQGHLIDDNTWESVPFSCADSTGACAGGGAWLDFPGASNYFMQLVDAQTGKHLQGHIYNVTAFLGTSPHPDNDNSKMTMAGGNLAEWTIFAQPTDPNVPPTVYVENDTCSEYFLRVLVQASPTPADAGADSSADASKD